MDLRQKGDPASDAGPPQPKHYERLAMVPATATTMKVQEANLHRSYGKAYSEPTRGKSREMKPVPAHDLPRWMSPPGNDCPPGNLCLPGPRLFRHPFGTCCLRHPTRFRCLTPGSRLLVIGSDGGVYVALTSLGAFGGTPRKEGPRKFHAGPVSSGGIGRSVAIRARSNQASLGTMKGAR